MTQILERHARIAHLFPHFPAFRLRQVDAALFHKDWACWEDVTPLSASDRTICAAQIPWMSVRHVHALTSARKDTVKAVLATEDDKKIETVLMRNQRGQWTICVSSQVGCPMGCTFCATSTMGFVRNLTEDEIVDQYRYWSMYLQEQGSDFSGHITNIVFMGMGEPLANYISVRSALRTILAHTAIGPTRITVSTVGLLPRLHALLKDPLWPPVRLAISLHSADAATRMAIMPSSSEQFLEQLHAWSVAYFDTFPSRRHHVTFEYILLGGVNDTQQHATQLIRFARRVGRVRINVIPYNMTGTSYHTSTPIAKDRFIAQVRAAGVTVTCRRTMGDDIAAACGQLVTQQKPL